MMLPINLSSLKQAYQLSLSGNPGIFDRYLMHIGIQLEKPQEKLDIMTLIEKLEQFINNHAKLNDFYLGYKIPQISKEFDLLRLGENYILNIEIKNKSNMEAVRKQLLKNRYYLKAVNSQVKLFSYVISTDELFYLDENAVDLSMTSFPELVQSINEQVFERVNDLDELFSPKNYLVSPLNSTNEFMQQNYFLTDQQEAIRKRIINAFDNQQIQCAHISGAAGTGKTLLAYDIAHHYMQQNVPVCVIHCGKLSEGHEKLKLIYGWSIFTIKSYSYALRVVEDGGVIIIDEAQRIFNTQIIELLLRISGGKAKCVFSFDPKQFISSKESKANYFNGLTVPHEQFQLSEKIRTNKEIASFIYNLFDRSKINTDPTFRYKNIHLQYFDNNNSVRDFLEYLKINEGWEILNYTPSQYNLLTFDYYQNGSNKNAHDVIGQEFDKVAVVINEYFYYDGKDLFSFHHPARYQMNQMLFQLLTRTREELYIVVYSNPELFEECMKIINRDNFKGSQVLKS